MQSCVSARVLVSCGLWGCGSVALLHTCMRLIQLFPAASCAIINSRHRAPLPDHLSTSILLTCPPSCLPCVQPRSRACATLSWQRAAAPR